ncbi:DNA ligase/mRNA capping enzyme [Aureobasidium sp. EXF-3400]|nr:DNA ligase/mRNA capping enzyme [Aureobasidium sp. EXF-12344]KAI4782262.1 DNA ligase/mRNA capping enzyme [Aureobasidium sp. EXF-3400]
MSFKFAHICDYLERCEEISSHNPPLPPAELKSRLYRQHATWFASHHKDINDLDEQGTTALLSTFLPCRRKDRIYGLQSASLLKLLGRCLGLSTSARHELSSFQTPNNGDLGDCLQRLLKLRGPPPLPFVTLQEVDDALHALASGNRFSAQSVRQSFHPSSSIDSLADVLLRLHPVEAKWFVRLILKEFAPVSLNDRSILVSVHFLLPDLLSMQDSFANACLALKTTFADYPSRPDPQSRNILRQTAISLFRPTPGVKISRPEYTKARSIKHCLQMTAGGKWLLERKYDGEYCQIHIDLARGDDWLKIYSKSGRDSTEDRAGLRETIKKCLRIGSDKCRFKRACVIVGEMVVFSDTENSILGFDKIRQHVSRAGTFIGVENHSPGQPGEHLMIILFDLLLLDDEDILSRSVEERKARLSSIYKRIHGHAAPAESCVMNFSQVNAERRLMNHFAASIASRHEGLVLKPCGVSYLSPNTVSGIKLKKDYIAGLGDEADFAVVGASYSAQEAKKRSDLRLKFTHFHLGCLMDKGALLDGTKPVFRIVATIAYDHCMSREILERVNIEGSLLAEPYSERNSPFIVESDNTQQMEVCFRDPLVFEVLGSSYSKLPGGSFMLRHPRVKKLHQDRTWKDCITFSALQSAAAEALDSPQDSETQENVRWIAKLESSHKRRFARHSLNTTPRTSVADTTPRSAQSDSTCTPHSESASRIKPLAVLGTGSRLKAIQQSDTTPSKPTFVLPTPPESSPLDRLGQPSTILGKRKLSESRDNGRRRPHLEITSAPDQQRDQPVGGNLASTPRTPLADITQQIARRSVESSSVITRRSSWAEGHCKFGKTKALAPKERCILSQSVVFVAGLPELEKKQVTRKVLEHGAVMVQDLSYWDRDSHTQPDTDCVHESQAYKGLRKVVLVDPRETSQYRACYTEIERLRLHRVEIFDYRLVKAMCSNAEAG